MIAMAAFKVEYPRRQAMLKVVHKDKFDPELGACPSSRVPVFVWPMPTQDGCFIVEHQDGRCQKVQPYELTFLGSKELFDQYDWSEA